MLQIAIDKRVQHKKFTIVFIGGSHDGEVREVEKIPPAVQMPVVQKPQSFGIGDPANIQREEYKRLDLTYDFAYNTSTNVAVTYVHHALTEVDVLNIILTRYVQSAGSESK